MTRRGDSTGNSVESKTTRTVGVGEYEKVDVKRLYSYLDCSSGLQLGIITIR